MLRLYWGAGYFALRYQKCGMIQNAFSPGISSESSKRSSFRQINPSIQLYSTCFTLQRPPPSCSTKRGHNFDVAASGAYESIASSCMLEVALTQDIFTEGKFRPQVNINVIPVVPLAHPTQLTMMSPPSEEGQLSNTDPLNHR